MQLLGIQYRRDNTIKNMVVLLLVDHPDRMSCLRSDKLSQNEIELLKQLSSEIDNMEIRDRIAWFKENISSYPKAYRELKKEYAVVKDSFDL